MGSWKAWARSGKGLEIRTLSGDQREPTETKHVGSALSILVWGSAVAQGGISPPENRLWAEGLPAAAHLPHHMETEPTPHVSPCTEGALTPRLCPKPVLGAGLAALM